MTLFRSAGAQGCVVCHTLPTGLGTDMNFVGNTWIKLPLGTNGEHHVALVATNRSLNLPFKIAQLRGLRDRMGFDLASSVSQSGFGFGHDGRVDTLVRFIQDGFDLRADQDVADMIAFLLCFNGSDLPEGTLNDPGRSPGVAGRDVPASVGALWLITQALVPADLSALITRNDPPTGRVDFVARAVRQGRSRGWIYDRALKLFRGERTADNASLSSLVSSASSTNPLLVTAVPRGVGEGFSTDHDGDGYSDQIEIDSGTDPDDPESNPGPNGFRLAGAQWKDAKLMISWRARTGFLYQLQSNISLAGPMWIDEGPPIPPQLPLVEHSIEISGPEAMRYFRVVQKEAQ